MTVDTPTALGKDTYKRWQMDQRIVGREAWMLPSRCSTRPANWSLGAAFRHR